MSSDGRLQGRVAVITGGGGGIGREMCLALAGAGAHVVAADVDEGAAASAATAVRDAGGSAEFAALDVTSEESWVSLIGRVRDDHGGLGVLVNNAGIFLLRHIDETTEEEWDRVMAVNAKGVFLGTKHAAQLMRDGGGGSIINISSASGITGSPFEGAYTASKGAVRLFTKSAALRFARDGIRVNSVHPATVDTSMVDVLWESDPNLRDNVLKAVPLGRLARPEEIARTVLFLASDDSSFMTGSEVIVDGGMTAI